MDKPKDRRLNSLRDVAGMLDKIIPGDLKMMLGLDADDPEKKPQQSGSGSKYFNPGMPTDQMFHEPKATAEKEQTTQNHYYANELKTAAIQPSTIHNNNASSKQIVFNNTQNIQGGNSLEVAEESARRFQMLDMYPGEYAPVTQ